MPVEIGSLQASARVGAPDRPGRLSDAEVERVARRVMEFLKAEERAAMAVRIDNSARTILGRE